MLARALKASAWVRTADDDKDTGDTEGEEDKSRSNALLLLAFERNRFRLLWYFNFAHATVGLRIAFRYWKFFQFVGHWLWTSCYHAVFLRRKGRLHSSFHQSALPRLMNAWTEKVEDWTASCKLETNWKAQHDEKSFPVTPIVASKRDWHKEWLMYLKCRSGTFFVISRNSEGIGKWSLFVPQLIVRQDVILNLAAAILRSRTGCKDPRKNVMVRKSLEAKLFLNIHDHNLRPQAVLWELKSPAIKRSR